LSLEISVPLLEDARDPLSSFFSNFTICSSKRLMRASFSALSLEGISSVAFMLANSSSKFIEPIIIAGMMTVWDDFASDYEKTIFFDDDAEESLL